MPSITPALKEEICRLARREIKAQAAPTRQAIVEYRRQLAELKRQLRRQQRIIASLQSQKSKYSPSPAANETASEHERWVLNRPRVLKGIQEGLQQAANGEFVENPPDFEADMAKARKALEKFNRKKAKGQEIARSPRRRNALLALQRRTSNGH